MRSEVILQFYTWLIPHAQFCASHKNIFCFKIFCMKKVIRQAVLVYLPCRMCMEGLICHSVPAVSSEPAVFSVPTMLSVPAVYSVPAVSSSYAFCAPCVCCVPAVSTQYGYSSSSAQSWTL